ncbi:sensor histidine kinase [Nocardia sp. SYP-A9097]|uniref:sensor histidine kinase n=1 Tax=Nocardia sp. SYP-A9097 TaxID=2663237 RepID=UPI001E31BDE6|nr:sensor histidine kinase [Nocardia sp. SYP-A9097]
MDPPQAIDPVTPSVLRSNLWYRLWAAFVIVGCSATGGAIFLLSHQFPANRFGATAALAGIVVWTLVSVRAHLGGPNEVYRWRRLSWRTVTFVLVAMVLFAVALSFAAAAVAALPVLYSLAYLALPLRSGLVAGTAISLLPTLMALLTEGVHGTDVPLAVVISVIGLAFSPIIGAAIRVAVEYGEQQTALLAELEESRAESARLSRVAGQASERARLAQEIHDTLAQGFTSIVALVQAIDLEVDTDPAAARRHLGLIEETARENLAEARTMVVELTPAALTSNSLSDALSRLAERLRAQTEISVTVHADPMLPVLGTAAEVALLRVAQEALANVRKHAAASQVDVMLAATPSGVRLSLADNGIGFTIAAMPTGFGLRGMRDRVELIGGTLSVTSRPGHGTTVQVVIPR